MKLITTTFLLLLFQSMALSQISITQYDMPIVGNVYLYYQDAGLLTADYTQTGANQNWDYSQSGTVINDTLKMSSVTSTPFAYQLYFNNSFLYPNYKANYAVRAADVNAFNQVTIEDRYDFYKKNPSSLEIVGFGANVNTIPASVKYDTIDKVYHFPMQYQDVDYSVGYFITSIPTLGTYGSHIKRKIETDGWGSITTPSKTYPNALRVKTTLNIKDTVYVNQFSFGTQISRPVEVIYEWWTNEDNSPVMIVNVNAGQVTRVRYLAPISTSIVENTVQSLNVIPTANESIYQLTGTAVAAIESVYCYDISGKLIPADWNTVTNTLTLESLSKGIVLVTVVNKDGQQHTVKLIH